VVLMTGRIEANPGARRELSQALLEWAAVARGADGAQTHLYEDMEGAPIFCFVSQWPDVQSLARHARSQPFGGLIGAIELLASSSIVTMVNGDGGPCGLLDLRRRAQAALAGSEGGATVRCESDGHRRLGYGVGSAGE
jgi:quinol monooxygenase YgiN